MRLNCKIDLQRQDEYLLVHFRDAFGGGYLGRREYKGNLSSSYETVSFGRMRKLINYLEAYQLNSKKYLEYFYLRKTMVLIENGVHTKNITKIKKYQNRMRILKVA